MQVRWQVGGIFFDVGGRGKDFCLEKTVAMSPNITAVEMMSAFDELKSYLGDLGYKVFLI